MALFIGAKGIKMTENAIPVDHSITESKKKLLCPALYCDLHNTVSTLLLYHAALQAPQFYINRK